MSGSPEVQEADVGRFPLSSQQRLWWAQDSMAAFGPRFVVARSLRVNGQVNTSALQEALDDVAARHEILRTVVVREQGNIAILPVNKGAVPIVQARFSLKWDVSRILSAIVWAQYIRDNNGTFVARDPSEGTVALRTFLNPDFFGLGTSVQARF